MDTILPTPKDDSYRYASLSFPEVAGVTIFTTDAALIVGDLAVGDTSTVTEVVLDYICFVIFSDIFLAISFFF